MSKLIMIGGYWHGTEVEGTGHPYVEFPEVFGLEWNLPKSTYQLTEKVDQQGRRICIQRKPSDDIPTLVRTGRK